MVIQTLHQTLAQIFAPLTKTGSRRGGFTLIETMVTMLVLLVVLAAIQRFLFAGFTAFMFGQDTYDAQAKVELAQKYLDRTLRETREVLAADPYGRYVAVLTDSDNDGNDEVLEYFVDYSDRRLKEYRDDTPGADLSAYNFASPESDANLQMSEIVADISGDAPTSEQDSLLSPNNADSGRPFIFFGDSPRLSLDYSSGAWQHPGGEPAGLNNVKGIRTYFLVDVSPTSGPTGYYLQTYIRFRNID